MSDCFACRALCGAYEDSADYFEWVKSENPELNSDNLPEAANAWLAYFQKELPHIFKDFDQAPDLEGEESFEGYVIDVVMDLLHRAGHPLFAPLPEWMPVQLADAAKRLAKLDALNDDDVIRKFVHDRIAPKEEWLIADTDLTHITALGLTSKQMALLVQQVFNPMFSNTRPDLLASLHTCNDN